MTESQHTLGKYTLSVTKDDRGRIVAEVWDTVSGKTLGITEANSRADALHWAKKTIEMVGN